MSGTPAAAPALQAQIDALPPEKRALFARLLRESALAAGAAPRIPRRADAGDAPLAAAQRRLWVLDQLHPGSPFYNVTRAFRLEGALDAAALARAVDEVARRHEALRTVLVAGAGGEPVQRVVAPASLGLVAEDAPGADAALREAAREARRPFDLARGPLFRARLLRVAAEEHLLVLVFHHVVVDGWSVAVVMRELSALYADFAAGRAPSLAEPELQYADWAAWREAEMAGGREEAQLAFWRDALAGLGEPASVPADFPRPASPAFRGGVEPVALPASTLRGLREVARSAGATLPGALLAALHALVYRLSGEADTVVAQAAAGRSAREMEGVVGFFANLLPMRARLADGLPFRALVERVGRDSLAALSHADVPFDRLAEAAGAGRGRAPLAPVVFAWESFPPAVPAFPGIVATAPRAEALHAGIAKFDLTFLLHEADGEVRGVIEYDAERFLPATVRRLAERFALLAGSLAAAPERPIGDAALLDDADRAADAAWNRTAAPLPAATIPERFAARVAAEPSAPALRAGERRWSYAELDAWSTRLAGRLRAAGVGPETPVAILLHRSAESVAAMLAVLKAGGAYVPLDPDHPRPRLERLVASIRPPVAVVDAATAPALAGLGVRTVDVADEPGAASGAGDARPPSPDALAYVLFTSGSTGEPKAVGVTHRAVVNLTHAQPFGTPGPGDVVAHGSALSFDAATWEVWGALLNGAALTIVERDTLLAPAALGRAIRAEGITAMFLTTSLFHAVARAEPEALAPLGALVVGGEALETEAANRAAALLPPRALRNGYGPTETTTFAAWHAVDGAAAGASVPIGRPLGNARLHVLDARLRPVPAGTPGELLIAGCGVARGYLNDPARTAERFVPDPFSPSPGGRAYRTGDRARRTASGALEYLGRGDQQVKVRGFRIEPGEVEAALRGHPSVDDAVVVARDEPGGEKSLVGYAAARPGAERPSPASLRAFLEGRLPAFMVPAALVVLDALPLNGVGKVDRRALPEPDVAAAAAADGYVAPRGVLETLVAESWSGVLGGRRVGAADDVFAMGANSLLAAQAAGRIRAALGAEVPLRWLFEAASPAELAARLAGARAPDEAPPPLAAFPDDGAAPLSFAQERLWFLHQLDPASTAYDSGAVLHLRGALDAAALGRALAALVERHEPLRTVFPLEGGRPVQRVLPAAGWRMSTEEVADVAAGARLDACRRRVAEGQARAPFALERGPLFRATLYRLDECEHVLALVLHHTVFDGWSLGVLARELPALYAAARDVRPAALPPLPVRYRDFARWQREWLAGPALERQLAYWRERLAGLPVLHLPTDRPRPAVKGSRGGRVPLRIDAEAVAGLRALCRKQGATLFAGVLTAIQLLLARWSGEHDLAVGTPVAGRGAPETEGLIGFFAGTLVLRADLAGDPTVAEAVARARDVVLEALAHQDLPFEKLVEALRPERDLSHNPLFQVLLSLQDAPAPPPALDGVEAAFLAVDPGTAPFDLAFVLLEDGGALAGHLQYDAELFDEGTARRFAAQLDVLLRGALEGPSTRASALPVLTGEERRAVLHDWNRTAAPRPAERCAHDFFEASAARAPEATALVQGAERLTYAALDRRADALAAALRARGVGPGTLVGISLERSPALVVAVLATWKAGGAYLPLDPAHPAERLAFMAADARPALVIARGTPAAGLPASLPVLDPDGAFPAPPASGAALRRPGGGDLAYVIYTSGSTGRPKGVMVEHAGIGNLAGAQRAVFAQDAASRILLVASLNFDASLFEMVMAFAAGAELHLAPAGEPMAGSALAARLREGRITTVTLTPSALASIPAGDPLPDLATLVCAGEALPAPLAERWVAGRRLFNAYGPTETTVWATVEACDGAAARPAIGRPVANTRAYVVDRAGHPAPVGVTGELLLGGAGLARGYLGRAALTAERFVPDPFSGEAGARLYRTGDLARRLPDGRLDFADRIDHQVKVRGFRIEPGEVEAALAAHPAVEAAAVVAAGDGAARRLLAYVAPAAGAAAPGADALRAWLRERLPEYMVPERFVELAALPLNASGKVDRRALPAFREAPSAHPPALATPESALEREIAAVWREVLKRAEVGAEENFFDAGGQSILLAEVFHRLRPAHPALLMVDLFNHPTIRSLARRLGGAGADGDGAAAASAEGEERAGLRRERADGRSQRAARRRAAAWEDGS